MSAKSTWYWLLLAGGLFAFIFFYQRHVHKGPMGPTLILPRLEPAAVTSIQVHAGTNQFSVSAERTNGVWRVTQPLSYPAQATVIDKLLAGLARLAAADTISETELRAHTNADEEFGLTSPQASLIVTQANYRTQLLVGARTAPGDQVYVKLVAGEGLSIVDADLLKLIPHSVDDWRDRDLLHLAPSTIDSVAVTNNGKAFVVGRDSTNGLWRMIWPLFQARADGGRIRQGLGELESLRIERFVSDDPKADLEAFGLQTPNLEIAMAQGTNLLPVLQLGKSPTNHAELVFARRAGQSTIVTVRKALLATWQVDSVNAFRDPHLLELVVPVERIEVHGEDVFNLDRQTNGAWRVAPQGYPADGESVSNLISALTGMVIVQFAKDVATPLNWPEYGLAAPVREYVLESAATNEQAALTNPTIADLSFGYGTNQPDKVFVRRADETSVYAVSPNDFAQLPPVSWQMRDRRIWRFLVDDLAGLTIQQGGKKRELIRRGDHEWSLAAGSQGIIDEAAIDESVRNFLATPPLGWMAVGETNRSRFGFTADGQQLIFMLKNGPKPTVEFGGDSPTGSRYAGVMLDGQFWVMELPWSLNRYVLAYLSLPEGL